MKSSYALGLLNFSLFYSFGSAFHNNPIFRLQQRSGSNMLLVLSSSVSGERNQDDFDDFSSFLGDAADAEMSADGQALAREFYEQLREREQKQQRVRETNDDQRQRKQQKLTEEEARSLNREPFGRRQEVIAGMDATSSSSNRNRLRKFTGATTDGRRDVDMPSSASLFTGRGASVYSVPSMPSRRMMQNELNLAGRAERSLFIQIIATLSLLSFVIYVGLTGGISSNDWSSVADSLDTSIEGIDGILPLPTDTEASIWL